MPVAAAPGTPSDGPPRGQARRRRWAAGRLVPPAVVLVGLAGLWQLVTWAANIAPTVLPGPILVARSTFDDRANLAPAVWVTTQETLLGLVVAVVVAVVIAVVIDWSRRARAGLYPLIVGSQTLPIITLAPLVVIWFGFGMLPKVLLVAFFSFFPITVGLVQGLAAADRDAVNLARTLRASRLQLLLKVRMPGALPQLFTGLKISVTYAYTSAVVAEFVGATKGIGVYMTSVSTAAPVRTDLELGATFVVAVLTVALFLLVGLLQRLAMPWLPPSGT
ncbi:MAG TPA: ABC transporter permease [Acidimicrobiales bacterium]|nr:ABC transporter permease [Acidimicrobiales bacterium]